MSNYPVAPIYTVTVTGSNGQVYDFSELTELKYTHALNRGSQAQLTIPMKAGAVNPFSTATRLANITVKRQDDIDAPKRLVWYGNLMKTAYSGDYNDVSMTMTFEDLPSLLAYRYTASTYEVTAATDTSTIMEDILTATQAETGGNLGITTGSLTASKNRTAEEELKDRSVLSIFESYSEVIDGIDWEISPTLQNFVQGQFNTFYTGATAKYHKGSIKDIPLTFKVDSTGYDYGNNIKSFSISERGEMYANKIRMKGATVEDVQLSAESSDTTAISSYGLFMRLEQENDISEQDTLDDRADESLNARRNIPYDISLELVPHVQPRVTTFDVGDIFNVDFNYYGKKEFIRQYRVYECTVTVNNDNTESISLGMNIV